MEEGLRAAQALPGAHQAVLPAGRHPPELPQTPGARAAACVLVRDVPARLRVSYACGMTERDPTDIDPPGTDPIADTRRWLERAVIGLTLCPFAKAVYGKDQVRFVLSDATLPGQLLEEL